MLFQNKKFQSGHKQAPKNEKEYDTDSERKEVKKSHRAQGFMDRLKSMEKDSE